MQINEKCLPCLVNQAVRVAELTGQVYPVFADLVRELEAEYGTLICRELCAPQGDFEGRARKKSCQQMIGYCCRLVEKYAE